MLFAWNQCYTIQAITKQFDCVVLSNNTCIYIVICDPRNWKEKEQGKLISICYMYCILL